MGGVLKRKTLRGDACCYYEDLPAPGSERGQSVIVLHGFPDTPGSFSALGQALANDGYRVLRPYLPGYAPSTFSGPRGVEQARDWLLEFVRMTTSERVHLVGHDWGAVLSYALLADQPGRFSKAVTISVPHLGQLLSRGASQISQWRRSFYILFFQLPFLPEQAMRPPLGLAARLCQRWSPGFAFPQSRIEEIEQCIRASGSAPFAYYRDLAGALRLGAPARSSLSTPLLYIHGRDDACIDWKLSRGQERFFAAEYESLILSCGHFPHLEEPEELAAALIQWFAD